MMKVQLILFFKLLRNICFAEVMVEFTIFAGTKLEAVIAVTEGQPTVEVCVEVSGATISEREVMVHVATSELQDDPKAASK